jgi:hypothetical protein
MNSPHDSIPAEVPHLGPKQAEFGAASWGRIGRGCLGCICTFIGILMFVAIVVGLINGRFAAGLFKLAAFGGLFLVGGIALLRSIRAASGTRVEVYADGLALWDGPTIRVCRWQEIRTVIEKEAVSGEEVVEQALQNETRAFRLYLNSGELIILKSYLGGLAELGDIIKQNTLPHLLPVYLAEWEQMRSLDFGAIGLCRDGIKVENQTLPWSDVREVKRKGGWIALHKQGGWTSWKKVKLSDVPNAHILLEMIAQHSHYLIGNR